MIPRCLRRWNSHLWVLLAIVAMLVGALGACGGGSGAALDSGSGGSGTMPTPASATLNAVGGRVAVPDGSAVLTVPAGALAAPTAISITQVAASSVAGLPADEVLGATLTKLSADLATLVVPAELAIRLAPQWLQGNWALSAYQIAQWDGRGWIRLATTADAQTGTLKAQVSSIVVPTVALSVVGVAERAKPLATATTSSGTYAVIGAEPPEASPDYTWRKAKSECLHTIDAGYNDSLARLSRALFGVEPSADKGCVTNPYLGGDYARFVTNMPHHAGLDFRATKGAPVYTPLDGTVVEQRLDESAGDSTLTIKSRIGEKDYFLLFLHCSSHDLVRNGEKKGKLAKGDQILTGDQVCLSGGVGAGVPHLHFEIKRVDRDKDPASPTKEPSESDPYPGVNLLAMSPGRGACASAGATCTLDLVRANTMDPAIVPRPASSQPMPVVTGLSPTNMPADDVTRRVSVSGTGFRKSNAILVRWTVGDGANQWKGLDNRATTDSLWFVDDVSLSPQINPGTDNDTLQLRVCKNAIEATDPMCTTTPLSVVLGTGAPTPPTPMPPPSGSFDKSFATTGYAVSPSPFYYAHGVALPPDGGIVVAGNGLIKYRDDGMVDSSFGANGIVTSDKFYRAMSMDTQGRFVVVNDNGTSGELVRYLAKGDIDSSFGTGGRASVAFTPQSIVHDSQGRMIVVGYAMDTRYALVVARYTAAGVLDSSFGSTGVTLTHFGGATSASFGYAVAVDALGRIVAGGGVSDDSTGAAFALARYTSDGQLDSTFGTGGKVTTAFDTRGSASISSILFPSGGRILVAGTAVDVGDMALARYFEDGTLDPSFGADGKTNLGLMTYDYGHVAAIDNSGRIVVAGRTKVYCNCSSAGIARLLSNGSLDPSFGAQGKFVFAVKGNTYTSIDAMALDSQGRIVVAGDATFSGGGKGNYFSFVGRINP